MSTHSRSYPQFAHPDVMRLVKLRNILLERGATAGDRLEQSALVPKTPGPAEPLSPARPTYAEIMAIVNRPRRRHRGKSNQ